MNNLENKQIELMETKQHTEKSQTKRDLRFILTQKCNYQCSFCHKEGCDGSEKNLLGADDYAFLFSTAKDSLGINQVTLSGGEPIMRSDIIDINQSLHESGAKITMVSNGSLVSQKPEALKYVDILNLSLHNTNQELYTAITGSNTKVSFLIDSIINVQRLYPNLQIKLNSAIIQDQNTPNTEDFETKMRLASKYGWKLKYLELSEPDIPGFVDLNIFEKELFQKGFIKKNHTPRQYMYTKDTIELISGRVFCSEAKKTNDPQGYCKKNNDIYITPDGYLSTCPMDIKKIAGYDTIIDRDTVKLNNIFEQTIDQKTKYQCSFSL